MLATPPPFCPVIGKKSKFAREKIDLFHHGFGFPLQLFIQLEIRARVAVGWNYQLVSWTRQPKGREKILFTVPR